MIELRSVTVLAATLAGSLAAGVPARGQEPPKVQVPDPKVPQIMTLEGRYVRVAYNNEGYAILGYRLANISVGENWMLLEVGFTLRDGVKDYEMTREALSLSTPDGKTIPLAGVKEYQNANLSALQMREKVARDSINYFPPNAHQACRLGFFAELNQRSMAWDNAELTDQRACLGRIFFEIPGGITHGQYWLNVKFANSLIRVPFRILTKEEDKMLEKNYKDIKKQVDEAFKKKG
jgi:hypothetical protein